MKKVLFTGGTGFVGKNVIPILEKDFQLLAPSRRELNLLDFREVESYIRDNDIQIIVHSANPNAVKNSLDSDDRLFKESLKMFMNFYRMRHFYEKMIYLGSGAEYDKRTEIKKISENEIGKSIPEDDYGFAKYIINELACNSENIYNLRLFACYGPYDFYTKFITHAIRCCIRGESLTIRQDCMFDYLHVYDLAKIIKSFIENQPLYHDYNVCSGYRIKLSQIAEEVIKQMNSDSQIIIKKDGMNNEYTADNTRLAQEFPLKSPISLAEGIKMQIQWEKEHYEKEGC